MVPLFCETTIQPLHGPTFRPIESLHQRIRSWFFKMETHINNDVGHEVVYMRAYGVQEDDCLNMYPRNCDLKHCSIRNPYILVFN